MFSNITVLFFSMSNTATASSTRKAAYQRPYKSRSQRREVDRRKHDEANDYRFLIRVGVGVAVLVVLVLSFVAKGTLDQATEPAAPTEALR